MRIAPHAMRAARMAATVLPLALLAAACTAAPPASGPGAPSAQSGAPSAQSAAPPAVPALTGAHPCRDLPRFTCSYLTVPLDRSGKVPGTLRLQVAAAANTHAPRGTLLFLTGGPGQPGVRFVAPVAHELATAMGAYRLLMIDQRGTGGQALDCPDLQRQMGESDTLPPTAQAVRSCAQTLGVRRNFFTTVDTVADLGSLRQALHVRSWTLDGRPTAPSPPSGTHWPTLAGSGGSCSTRWSRSGMRSRCTWRACTGPPSCSGRPASGSIAGTTQPPSSPG
jgi:hypothetical protein